jgi:hypothetical protein
LAPVRRKACANTATPIRSAFVSIELDIVLLEIDVGTGILWNMLIKNILRVTSETITTTITSITIF